MNLKALEKFLPEAAKPFVINWLKEENIIIKILPSRQTKLGDYRFLKSHNKHQITIDGNLKSHAFFFVLTHEIAHLFVYKKFQNRVLPHGKEWKLIFGKMLLESIEAYPKELIPYIYKHALNPRASVGADVDLHKNLFLDKEDLFKLVENLSYGQKFRLGKRVYEREQKRKIRYLCREIKTNKLYLVNGQALVDEII